MGERREDSFESGDSELMRKRLCPMERQLYPRKFYRQVFPLSPELGFRWFEGIFRLKLWQ